MKKIIILFFLGYNFIYQNVASALEVNVSPTKIFTSANIRESKIYIEGKKEDSGDLIIVFKSGKMDYKIYSKKKTFGIWKDSNAHILHNIYRVYLLQTEKKGEIPIYGIFREFEIGALNIYLDTHSTSLNLVKTEEYRQAFLEYKVNDSSYLEEYGKIQVFPDGRFKTAIELPKEIKTGKYLLEIFLIEKEKAKALKVFTIHIEHAKSTETIRQIAKENKALYACFSILISITLALLSFGTVRILYYNRVFRKKS